MDVFLLYLPCKPRKELKDIISIIVICKKNTVLEIVKYSENPVVITIVIQAVLQITSSLDID